jgi:hypothetical protein
MREGHGGILLDAFADMIFAIASEANEKNPAG